MSDSLNVMKQKIDRENRKRTLSLVLYVVACVIGFAIVVISRIDILWYLAVVWGSCGLFLIYEHRIHKRIQRIIDGEETDSFRL